MSKKENASCADRKNTVGGQAVIEGVMMKSGGNIALAVRAADGEIKLEKSKYVSAAEKHKFLKLPLVRGVVNFIEMMKLSMSTLTKSAEMLGLEEEESKFEKKLKEKTGLNLTSIASIVGIVLGLGLSFLLFMYLPVWIGSFVKKAVENTILISLAEGLTRIVVFVVYILLVSLMKDIRRTFQYHGAEHMSVFCHEAGEELTVENVRRHSRFHPRCGTSFLVIMMVIGILISSIIPVRIGDFEVTRLLRTIIKLALLPLVVGLGYEFIRFAGKHDNIVTRILSAPGLWVQRITTKKPDDSQLEVAIVSLKAALPSFYPEADTLPETQPAEDSETVMPIQKPAYDASAT